MSHVITIAFYNFFSYAPCFNANFVYTNHVHGILYNQLKNIDESIQVCTCTFYSMALFVHPSLNILVSDILSFHLGYLGANL